MGESGYGYASLGGLVRIATLILALGAVGTQSALGATLTVDPGGAGDFATIGAAIAGAADGDSILVQPGTYAEQVDPLGKELDIRGVGGASVTVIAAPTSSCMRFAAGEGRATVVSGLTVQGCSLHGVLVNGASPTLRDLVIINNGGPAAGGGLLVTGGDPLLEPRWLPLLP